MQPRSTAPRCGAIGSVLLAACCTVAPGLAHAAVLHIRAGAAAAGADGSALRPFASLQAAEQASAPGDTLLVLAAPRVLPPLDGGIALKPGQKLLGEPDAADNLARITNSSARLGGDAVVLARDSEVAGLLIEGPRRGGIYGRNVPGANVHDNEIVGHNRSCSLGLVIEAISIPSSIPGAVIPQPLPLPNGWAGIMIDADGGSGTLAIRDNTVRDAGCGDGIDLRLSGDADYSARIDGNTVHDLEQGPVLLGYLSVLAIGMKLKGSARLDVALDGNTQYHIGTRGSPVSDSEGVFATLTEQAELVADVNRNTFYRGFGGWSANGLELVINSGSARAVMQVRNSSFRDVPGDVIEGLNLGTGSHLELRLDNVVAMDSVGAPFLQDIARPFTYAGNLGDCLTMTSAGAGNTLLLEMRNSRLENCVNNALTISSNTLLGSGPANRIAFDIDNSRIVGGRFHNLKLANLARAHSLSGRVQRTDLGGAGKINLSLERDGIPPNGVVLDFGGGALGSVGGNCLDGGGLLDLEVDGVQASLKHNWWGRPGGPGWFRTLVYGGGSAQTAFPAASRPTYCSR